MPDTTSRRKFLEKAAIAAYGLAVPRATAVAQSAPSQAPATRPAGVGRSRVVIARDDALTRGKVKEHAELIRKLLDAALQKLTDASKPEAAWGSLFKPTERIGIKVNTFGRTTHPEVAVAVASGLIAAGVPEQNIIIFDRCDWELEGAGYKLNKSGTGVKCYGTDQHGNKSLYLKEAEKSGQTASRFSAVVAEQVDVLISVPILKHHSMCGVTVSMKNFYGVIHNPGDYHGTNGDPFIVDVVSHPYIRSKWRLTVCDAIEVQYHAGPTRHQDFLWKYGGLMVGTDGVALDAVGASLVDEYRKSAKMKPLAADKSPYTYISTAASRGLGVADPQHIDRLEI